MGHDTVLMPAAMFEVLMKGRVARRVEELDDDTVAAIGRSSVSSAHAALDELIKDWTP